MVILDLAEALRARGWEVRVFANLITRTLAPAFNAGGIEIGVEPKGLRPFDFDLVWAQHHTAALLDYTLGPNARDATRFVFAHLSPYTEFEQPGMVVESLLADLVLCNSRETEAAVIDADLVHLPRRLFANPAPASFMSTRRCREMVSPRRIAAISNHLPPEVTEALALLRRRAGVESTTFGQEGDLYGRVAAPLLSPFDAVVTIGKSVQYAMAAGIPVYCYDRFGGPGYLTREVFDRAADFNFSGRCTPSRRSAEVLAQELVEHYPRALQCSARVPDPRFLLEPQLDEILAVPVRDNSEKAGRLADQSHRVRRESMMAGLIRRYYRSTPVSARRPA